MEEATIKFTYDFTVSPEGKAGTITELEDGDLLIEGWAASFDGLDREGENFVPGAFKAGIKDFMDKQRALCFHHKPDHGIGEVLELEEHEGKGLYMKARVDFQPESSPLRYIYNAIKKGTYKGLSVGGFFKRQLTPAGPRISGVDFTEISCTPVPVHSSTRFAVVAGKALADVEIPEKPANIEQIRSEDEALLREAVAALDGIFERIGKRNIESSDEDNSEEKVVEQQPEDESLII